MNWHMIIFVSVALLQPLTAVIKHTDWVFQFGAWQCLSSASNNHCRFWMGTENPIVFMNCDIRILGCKRTCKIYDVQSCIFLLFLDLLHIAHFLSSAIEDVQYLIIWGVLVLVCKWKRSLYLIASSFFMLRKTLFVLRSTLVWDKSCNLTHIYCNKCN